MARTASTLRPTESTRVRRAWGRAIATASPGKPPPVPTSITSGEASGSSCSSARKGQRLSNTWATQ